MSMEAITRLLQDLGGTAYITPAAEAFRDRIIDKLAGQLDDCCEDIEELDVAVDVQITAHPDAGRVSLAVRAVVADFETTVHLDAHELTDSERQAVLTELRAAAGRLPVPGGSSTPKVIVRKQAAAGYDRHIAARKLDVSCEWLGKSLPCTGHSCSERDDGKKDLEYRYSMEMIDRLCRIREGRFGPDDLQYIADLCCEGDLDWAEDLVRQIAARGKV